MFVKCLLLVSCPQVNIPLLAEKVKIVFLERHQAENFMALVLNGHLQVMGRQVRYVRWNIVKSAWYPYLKDSRAPAVGSRLLDLFLVITAVDGERKLGTDYTVGDEWKAGCERKITCEVTYTCLSEANIPVTWQC